MARRGLGAIRFLLMIGLAMAMGAGCQTGGGANATTNCYMTAGSNVDLLRTDGFDIDRLQDDCAFGRSSRGVFLIFTSPSGATWLYIRTADPTFAAGGAGFSVVDSTIVATFASHAGAGVDELFAALDAQNMADNSVMMASYVALGDGTYGWYESAAGGTLTVTSEGLGSVPAADGWPTGVGTEAQANFTASGVQMTTTVSGWVPAIATVGVSIRIGNTNVLDVCPAPGPGGAGCVIFNTACTNNDDCQGTCGRSICKVDGRGLTTSHCCVVDDAPCGTAGTGSECCSGACSAAGRCAPLASDSTCPEPDAGTGSQVWNCIDEPINQHCDCILVTPPRTNLATCPSAYDCCVVDATNFCACNALSGAQTCEGIRAFQTYQPARIVASCPP